VVLKHSTLGSNVTLSVSKSGLPGGPVTTTTRVFRGHQSFLVLTATRATTGALDATAQLGAGFHGVRTMMLTSGDGMTFNGTVDGQALLPFSANTTPSAVQLVGGRAVPKVRIKRAARALFRKLGQVDFQSS
jgi:hypothetical protein